MKHSVIKCSQGKDCQYSTRIKKGLKDLNSPNLSFLESTKVYVNSVCPCYRGLWNKCRKRWNNEKVYWYFIVNGTDKIVKFGNGAYKNITHVNDFRTAFLKEQISNLVWVFTNCSARFVNVFTFLSFVFYIWQCSDNASFLALFLMTFVICLIALITCLVLFVCCVVLFSWCSDNHFC